MKKEKGFTLVELLAVLVILSLLMVIAVPTTMNVSKKIKQKMLISKMTSATQAAVLWGQDNKSCFTVSNPSVNEKCLTLTCGGIADNKKTCTITIGALAESGYIAYDEGTTLLNPVNKNTINDSTVNIIYNILNKSISTGTYNVIETQITTK